MDYNKFFADEAAAMEQERIENEAAAQAKIKSEQEAYLAHPFIAELIKGLKGMEALTGSTVKSSFDFVQDNLKHDYPIWAGDYGVLVTNISFDVENYPVQLLLHCAKETAQLTDQSYGRLGKFDLAVVGEKEAQDLLRHIFKLAEANEKISLQDILGGGKPKPAIIPQGGTPASLM